MYLADGVVHLYRNYDFPYSDKPLQMVTSFRGLGTLVPMKRGSGIVLDWQQGPGVILAGGDSRTIRAWDAHRECALVVSALSYRCHMFHDTTTSLLGHGYQF